jgi:hypothetical protein
MTKSICFTASSYVSALNPRGTKNQWQIRKRMSTSICILKSQVGLSVHPRARFGTFHLSFPSQVPTGRLLAATKVKLSVARAVNFVVGTEEKIHHRGHGDHREKYFCSSL